MPSSIYERSPGSWCARTTVCGKQIWLGTYPTRLAAEAALIRAGRGELPSTITVEEWSARWQLVFPGKRNPQTENHNAQMIAPFARVFARVKMTAVTPMMAQPWAIKHPGHVRYLRLMFAKAVRAGILERNVWDAVEVPTAGAARPPAARRVPTLGEFEALVRAARQRYGDRVADMLVFTGFTGLRLSEMADVKACDVREDGRRLVVRGKRRPGQTDPRERTVAVFPAARDALLRHAPEVGLVWKSPTRRPWTLNSTAALMRAIGRDAGVEGVTFHGLRHFHATWLLNQGASDLDVAQQLGHRNADGTVDPTLVRRTYGHPDVEASLARLEGVAG